MRTAISSAGVAPYLADRGWRKPLLRREQRRLETIGPCAVDNHNMRKLRQVPLKRLRHCLMIEATKYFGHDDQLRFRELEHVTELPLAEDRHQRVDNRANPECRERDHGELPPIRQLNGDDIAASEAHALEGRGGA